MNETTEQTVHAAAAYWELPHLPKPLIIPVDWEQAIPVLSGDCAVAESHAYSMISSANQQAARKP